MGANRSPTGCPISHGAAAFTPFEGAYQKNPANALKWAREEEPVFYSPELGYWVVTRFSDVKAVFRDPLLFSPANALEKITPAPPEAAEILKSYGFAMARTMVNEDEPQHMARRRALLDAFLPENLARQEGWIREMVAHYIDRFIKRGQADLVEEIIREIPMSVALRFLGVPEEGARELRAFSVAHTLNTWGRPSPEEQLTIAHDVGRFWQTAQGILDGMMAQPDGEGWMYDSIRMHRAHPEIVPESYLRSMMMAILVAAHETTSYATSNAVYALLRDERAWAELCANPALIPNAVEECLRYAGSVVAWRRIATRETEIGGVRIPEGGKLLIVQASANHDETHWNAPNHLDIYRDNAAEHLTFGYGAHQCMGKNIARMEMRLIIEAFTRRLPHMRLVPNQKLHYLPNTSFRGLSQLWVEWDASANPEQTAPEVRTQQTSFPIGPPRREDLLRSVKVRRLRRLAPDVLEVELEDPLQAPVPPFAPGAHVDLVLGPWRRKYSLCGKPGNLSIAILKEPKGRGGSQFFHDHLREGKIVQIAGPKNHFRLDENARTYHLIAGGIGITPILAMADHLKTLAKPYHLHYCGQNRERMPFLNRLLRDHKPNNLTLHISQEGTRANLDELFGKTPETGAQIYACGPEPLLSHLEKLASAWPEGTFHREHFTPTQPKETKQKPFNVELVDSGLTLKVDANQSLLEALTEAGIDVPSDCGEGLCGSCEVKVLSGEIIHHDHVLSQSERTTGTRMMACCSRAKSNLRLAL